MKTKFSIAALLISALALIGCTAAQVIDTARISIVAEIAASAAAGFAPGVAYGNDALTALACIGAEYNSADPAIVKTAKISACAAINVPTGTGTQAIIVSAIDAAIQSVLAAYGIPLPATPTPNARAAHAAVQTRGATVKLPDGKPGMFDRRSVQAAVDAALKARKP